MTLKRKDPIYVLWCVVQECEAAASLDGLEKAEVRAWKAVAKLAQSGIPKGWAP